MTPAARMEMATNRAFIFLGPPGAGKGTQSKRFAQRCAVPHFSTGDMLRDAVSRGTDLGRLARPIMERGELVPDDVIMKMVEERLAAPDCAAGVVFDGFPRTLPQAEQLGRVLEEKGFGKPVVVDFEVSLDVLMRRLTGRWSCGVCGAIYNVYDAPPRVPGICDRDGGKLVQRPDDRPDVVKERLVAYERQTMPLADYYRRQGLLDAVDASAGMEDVSRALEKIIQRVEGRNGRL